MSDPSICYGCLLHHLQGYLSVIAHKHPNNKNFNNAVKHEMNLNEEQVNLFLVSANKHIEQMAIISDRQQVLWQSYFKMLSSIMIYLRICVLNSILKNIK